MYMLLEKYFNSLTIEKTKLLSEKNDIYLTDNELQFTYNFIKKNWNIIISNPNSFNIDKYSEKYSNDNFSKLKKLYYNTLAKYSHFLK